MKTVRWCVEQATRDRARVALLVVVVAFGWIVLANLVDVAGGSDSSGYLNLARRLSAGRATSNIEAIEIFDLDDQYAGIFVPLGFIPGANGTSVPYYPPGLPLLMTAFATLFGWMIGPFLIAPAAGVLGLLAFYALLRELGLSRRSGLAGVSILAACPTYVLFSLQPMSDVVAAAWAMAALAAALAARRHPRWILAAGAAFGIGVLVRPTNALVLPALVIAMPQTRRAWVSLVLAGVPFAIFSSTYNDFTYGGPFVNGYGNIAQLDVSWTFFQPRFVHYGRWLAQLLTPLVVLGFVSLPFDRQVPLRHRLMLLAWCIPSFVFYCTYRVYDAWWYTRFLIPVIGALVAASLLVAQDLLGYLSDRADWLWAPALGSAERRQVARGFGTALVLAVVVTGLYHGNRFHILRTDRAEQVYRLACRRAMEVAPAKSVILSMQASGAIRFYTDFVVARWDRVDAGTFATLLERIEAQGYRVYALLFPFEEAGFHRNVPGRWVAAGAVDGVRLLRLLANPEAPTGQRATPRD